MNPPFQLSSADSGAHHRRLEHHLPPRFDSSASSNLPVFLVGACERHNFGDLLMPHVVQRLLKDRSASSCVGLVDADLRGDGGHRVFSCETAFETLKSCPTILHFGGATLGCDLAAGYAMTLDGESGMQFSRLRENSPADALKLAQDRTGFKGEMAYVVDAPSRWEKAKSLFHAVGLSEPEKLSSSQKRLILTTLESADFVGIRDARGADFLEGEGVDVTRMPCGVTSLPTVCPQEWGRHSSSELLNSVRNRFPNGWIAVQVSGYRKKVFRPLVKALSGQCARMGLGVVFFAAGTAPGHDNVVELARQAGKFPGGEALFFPSRNVWDIAALIGNSEMYVGTSLHGRIIAMAAGIPRINLAVRFAKIQSYCRLWEHPSVPYELQVEQIGENLENLLDVDRVALQNHAAWLNQVYFEAFEKMGSAANLQTEIPLLLPRHHHLEASRYSRQLVEEWTGCEKTLRVLKRISRRKRKLPRLGKKRTLFSKKKTSEINSPGSINR